MLAAAVSRGKCGTEHDASAAVSQATRVTALAAMPLYVLDQEHRGDEGAAWLPHRVIGVVVDGANRTMLLCDPTCGMQRE